MVSTDVIRRLRKLEGLQQTGTGQVISVIAGKQSEDEIKAWLGSKGLTVGPYDHLVVTTVINVDRSVIDTPISLQLFVDPDGRIPTEDELRRRMN